MTPELASAITSATTTAAVSIALEEVCEQFANSPIEIAGDGIGGAYVVIARVDLGPVWSPPTSWLGFHVTHLHPAADVYPFYLHPDLVRADGAPVGVGLAPVVWTFGSRPALQVSRRSNRWNPNFDTPARKAVKVLDWLTRNT